MAAGRIDAWQSLLWQALEILDDAFAAHATAASWSLGGGTVLMLRYQHRLSKDIDIFVPDPQMLAEEANFLKLYLPEGEIDFVASGRITAEAVRTEMILGREMLVETSAEIMAKKIWHRAEHFTARDLVDFTTVAKRDRRALSLLKPVISGRRATLLDRLARHESELRDGFAALDLLQFSASFDECLELARKILGASGHSAEERRAEYRFVPLFGNRALTPI